MYLLKTQCSFHSSIIGCIILILFDLVGSLKSIVTISYPLFSNILPVVLNNSALGSVITTECFSLAVAN